MKLKRIPEVYRNVQDSSITLSYGKPKNSLIWLHGLCDTSQGFFSYFTHSHSPVYSGLRVKLIQAPIKHITINRGEVCHGWYDIMSTDRFSGDQKTKFNFTDIEESYEIISNHVDDEVKEWQKQQTNSQINPYHRVYVGGFSQGGVMALYYAMKAKVPPAGAICYSGYMLRSAVETNLQKFPILVCHGTRDPIIRQIMAKKSYQKLLKLDHIVSYKSIQNLEHSVNIQELDIMKQWIGDTFTTISQAYQGKHVSKNNNNNNKNKENIL